MIQYASLGVAAQPEEVDKESLALIVDETLAEHAFQSPRIVIAGSILTYDLSVPHVSDSTGPDQSLRILLALMLRNAELRRDLLSLPAEPGYWDKDAAELESLNSHLMDAAENGQNHTSKSPLSELKRQVESQLNRIAKKLVIYAGGREVTAVKAREGPYPFKVSVAVTPPVGRIRIMYFLDYKIAQKFGQPLDDMWDDLGPGIHLLRGRYRYRAVWPTALGKTEEGNFCINMDKILTFSPHK